MEGFPSLPGGSWAAHLSGDSFYFTSLLRILATCQLSKSNISNNIAALRALHVIHGLPTSPFKDERIPLFIKSLKLTKSFAPKVSPVLNTDLLLQIVQTCEALDHGVCPSREVAFFKIIRILSVSPCKPHY